MNFSTQLASAGACWIYLDPATSRVWLANDAGTAWLGPAILGSSNTLQNSQCTVNGSGSSASGSGNDLTLNLMLTFSHGFAGLKNAYMLAYDNSAQNSGWQQRGTWTVP